MYIHAYDLSLSCVGVTIFSHDGEWIETFSIKTNPNETHGLRLRFIGNKMVETREKYPCSVFVCEQGFSRFSASTQAIFKVNGIAQYLYYDVDQVFYAPTTIKKTISGDGRSRKDAVSEIINRKFPLVSFTTNDESDSFATGITFFIKKGTIEKWQK